MELGPNVFDDESLRNRVRVFRDRDDAGEAVARLLKTTGVTDALILAIPAGGIPVGARVAADLELPLDVLVVSKITLPWNTEAGFGAVAFDGTTRFNDALLDRLPLSQEQVDECVEATRDRVARRERTMRAGLDPLDLDGRQVVLVDDGLASGFTMRVAVEAARQCGAEEITVAAPTAHDAAIRRLVDEVERVVCPNVRGGTPYAVAAAYEHWADVPEGEALKAFKLAKLGD